MDDIFSRTKALVSDGQFNKLTAAHVVLCGCGGVGSYALEALVRTGIGKVTVIDNDTVSASNINRQIIALNSTVGKLKVDVARERTADINPDIDFCGIAEFLTRDNVCDILPKDADYIIDAIDHVPAKVALAEYAKKHGIPILGCLGTGNRLDAGRFYITDIYKTSGCPLARKMRYELKKACVDKLEVMVSGAEVLRPTTELSDGKRTVGSIAFVPSVAGLLCAQHVICKILES